MIQRREDLFAQCVDDLRMTADTLSRCAVELHAASHGLEAENPERLRQQARIDAATEVPTE